MCGILGIVALKGNLDDVILDFKDGLQSLYHRGPDGSGWYISPNGRIILGHRRLCIMDTSELSAQPFFDESKNYVLVFNGAIFNFNELRLILQKEGYIFRTTGDTEVVLRSYQHWGPYCFNLFNGFFAIAIYDVKKDELVLARDRYGEKPLVLYRNSHYIAFSSEIRAFKALNFPLSIDKKSVGLYFKYTYIPEPHSIYKEITKVVPGTYLFIHNGNVQQHRYYTFSSQSKEHLTQQESRIVIRNLFEDSVKLRLHAKVPVAVFLSGGIDSTLVSYFASKIVPDIQAFTISFPEYPYLNEAEIASETAKVYHLKHEIVPIAKDLLHNNAMELLDGLDEPFADSSAIAAYTLFRAVKGRYKVVLTGDGGDELFAGYRKHVAWYKAMRFPFYLYPLFFAVSSMPLPANRYNPFADWFRKIKKFSELIRCKTSEYYDFLASFHQHDVLKDLIIHSECYDLLQLQSLDIHTLNDFLLRDFQFVLPSDMLRKVDAVSMFNSVEARSPLLDYRLVDYVFSLPEEWKLDGRNGKKLLREFFSDLLPDHVRKQRKRGFEIPLDLLLSSMLKVDSKIFDVTFVQKQGIFKQKGVERLKNMVRQGKIKEQAYLIWAYVVFQNWYLKYGED
ncbi:MAG: asparagine synthase (glutamine-hydrolyzing) [Bacteroidales bacterium]|nr:asparagine synthase (glutamine-hydrolyzing) [Bacteroidales bacterium]